MTDRADEIAREIGGEGLVQFFDAILVEQRKRWNAPDWRLNGQSDADRTNWRDIAAALRSYAAEIEAERDRLAKEVECLRAALKPFADYCRTAEFSHEDSSDDRVWVAFNNTILTYGDLRAATRALAPSTPEGGGE